MLQEHRSSEFVVPATGKKRKTVQFEEPSVVAVECAPSTHECLRRRIGGEVDGGTWRDLASAYNCSDADCPDDGTIMDELLDLCSWWEDEEDTFGLEKNNVHEDESDNEEWLTNLKSHVQKTVVSTGAGVSGAVCGNASTDRSPTRNPSVRDLRFTSSLRLGSELFSSVDCDESECSSSGLGSSLPSCALSVTSSQATSESFSGSYDELENAFHGIVTRDNGVTRTVVRKEKKNEVEERALEDAFFGSGEF